MLRPVLVIALLATTHLSAADLFGRWTGTIETNGSGIPIYMTLYRSGGKITGSVATGTDLKQVPIEKAELRGDELTFEARNDANLLMRLRLTLGGTLLNGEATVGSETSKVSMSRPATTDDAAGIGDSVYRVGGSVSAPVLIHKVEPDYTEQARNAKFQGTVLLYAEIAPDGKAKNIRVQRSLGMGLDEKAIEAVKQWKFKPGHKDGKPVTVVATIEVNFRL